MDLRDSEDDGFEVKRRRRDPTFRVFDTVIIPPFLVPSMLILTARQIHEADEFKPPVAGLTTVRNDNESDISILDLAEEVPRQSPGSVRRRLLYAVLVS